MRDYNGSCWVETRDEGFLNGSEALCFIISGERNSATKEARIELCVGCGFGVSHDRIIGLEKDWQNYACVDNIYYFFCLPHKYRTWNSLYIMYEVFFETLCGLSFAIGD